MTKSTKILAITVIGIALIIGLQEMNSISTTVRNLSDTAAQIQRDLTEENRTNVDMKKTLEELQKQIAMEDGRLARDSMQS